MGDDDSRTRPGKLVLGMMSGTSLDGIDLALVEFWSDTDFTLRASQFSPYSDSLRDKVHKLAQNNEDLRENSDTPLHQELGVVYAETANSFLKNLNLTAPVAAIGNHGQTVKHEPDLATPYSIQLGDAQLIANLTGVTTISQFRQADMALGGQGAPLMPAFHLAAFGKSTETFVVNLGGIANITQLGDPVIGFDTGPANCLMDQWIELHQGQKFDRNGDWAATGTVPPELLRAFLRDPYFHRPYPKSTGTDYFNLPWLQSHLRHFDQISPQDIQASLVALTADSVALQLLDLSTQGTVLLCGGGAHNHAVRERLIHALPTFDISVTDSAGVPADWMEAMGFAWLAYCHMHGINSNLPSVTGASRSCVLGEKFEPT